MITRAVLFEQFAGRDEELQHLIDVRAASARELLGRTVSIVGEAGVGKSRLLTEFREATERERGAFVRVRCEELPVAYAPLVRALEQLQERRELRRTDALATALQLLTTADATATPEEGARKRTIFNALATAFVESARRLGQLTLAVDDVHWSDLSTLEALRALARSVRRAPMVLAITYRPEDLAADHARALAVGELEREDVDRITLGPLAFGDIASLLREPVPSASKELVRRIYDLSEGKPYVAEELARSVVERGFDVDPETSLSLRSAVLERVAVLAPGEREIIERAAVLGRNFAPDDLSALGTSEERLFAALRNGLELQLLEERQLGGAPWFRFRHALTREILYRNLLAIERRALHSEIADRLESQGDRIAELAYHRSAAGDAPRAVIANERAGDRAVGLAAFADAAKLFRRALEFTDDPEALARIGLKLAESLERSGDLDDLLAAIPHNAEKLAQVGRADDALVVLNVAIRALGPSRLKDALALVERAKGLLRPETAPKIRFEFELANAEVLRLGVRNEEALTACARAEACLPRPNPLQRKALLLSQAYCYMRMDELSKAQHALELRLREATNDGGSDGAETSAAMAKVSYRRGELRTAFRQCLETASRWQQIKHERAAHLQRCNAALVASDLGDFAFVTGMVESSRRSGTEGSQALESARIRTARAIGGDIRELLQLFERTAAHGTATMICMLGRDLPFMIADDRERARSIVLRAIERVPRGELDAELVLPVVAFGTDDDLARALEFYAYTAYNKNDPWLANGAALLHGHVARREHRTIEAAARAREAIERAERMEHWLYLALAYELAGDYGAARAALLRVGAGAELARLEGRRALTRAPEVSAPKLTQREEQVARLIAAGLSAREAGERLAIAARTVETHLTNVYLKLGINSRAELVPLMAQSAGTDPRPDVQNPAPGE
jgi:DNA-binding CsgD family transcriptional regulator